MKRRKGTHPEDENLLTIQRLQAKAPLHVLVADNEPAIRRIISVYLKEIDFTSTMVVNGLELIEAVKRSSPDIILTEAELPEENGLTAISAVREIHSASGLRIPIVVMSSTQERAVCLEADADEYLRKPILADRLFETFDRILS